MTDSAQARDPDGPRLAVKVDIVVIGAGVVGLAIARSLAMAGREVLNVFAFTGAFGVYAAAAGARAVIPVDRSAPALVTAERNMPQRVRCFEIYTVKCPASRLRRRGMRPNMSS